MVTIAWIILTALLIWYLACLSEASVRIYDAYTGPQDIFIKKRSFIGPVLNLAKLKEPYFPSELALAHFKIVLKMAFYSIFYIAFWLFVYIYPNTEIMKG